MSIEKLLFTPFRTPIVGDGSLRNFRGPFFIYPSRFFHRMDLKTKGSSGAYRVFSSSRKFPLSPFVFFDAVVCGFSFL